jgi:hypothetical protein
MSFAWHLYLFLMFVGLGEEKVSTRKRHVKGEREKTYDGEIFDSSIVSDAKRVKQDKAISKLVDFRS